MKTSTSVQPFPVFLNNLNESIYGTKDIDINNTHSGHVSFLHIKSIDKQIAKYIRNKEYISAHDKEQLYKLFDVIQNQGSQCTAKKLAKLHNSLKDLSKIKSESCKAWDAITSTKLNIKALDQHKSRLQQERDCRFQILYEKLSALPEKNIPEQARQKFADCIAEKDSKQFLIKFQDFIESCANKITINNNLTLYNDVDIKSIQKAISNLPASSLTWDQFKCELNEIRKLNSDLDKMEKNIIQSKIRIDTLAEKFFITNNDQGLNALKKMVVKPAPIVFHNKQSNIKLLRDNLFALTIRKNAELLTDSGN
ncbi:hypothetical protein AXB00_02935 [Salmonella enterica]|nr:hypothetical protein [Salmonella enterica]EAX3522098.1 hypothetical protein [Salmonella enterica]